MALTSRAQLRTRIASMLGDLTTLTATVAGSTTQFIDTRTLTSNMENPRNREFIFIRHGNPAVFTNDGLIRRITNSDLNAGWISFDALTAATAVGDVGEMYNFRGKGWLYDQYNNAINQAIAEAYPLFKQEYAEPVIGWSTTGHTLVVPEGYEYVYAVEYTEDDFVSWTPVPPATNPWTSGWGLSANSQGGSDPKITINDPIYYTPLFATDLINDTVRMRGYGPPQPLDADGDETSINPEWLCNKAASILCFSALDRDQGNAYRAQRFDQMAERHLSSIRTRMPGSTKRVYAGATPP
jgi:hypothetical protein